MDIVIESYRPGVMERLGLGPNVVHSKSPNIIYVRLSGYGQKDLRAGHDGTYLA